MYPELDFVVPMTCVVDGWEHAVTEAEFALGNQHGRYRAVCGHLVLAASLTEPEGQRCRGCAPWLTSPVVGNVPGPAEVTRRWWWLRYPRKLVRWPRIGHAPDR